MTDIRATVDRSADQKARGSICPRLEVQELVLSDPRWGRACRVVYKLLRFASRDIEQSDLGG